MNTKLQISILLIVTINIIGCGGAAQQPTPTSTPLPTSTPDIAATNTASVAQTAEAEATDFAVMRTATKEADNLVLTEQAQPYYDQVLDLQSQGIVNTVDGIYYPLDDLTLYGSIYERNQWTPATARWPNNFILNSTIEWNLSSDENVDLSISGCGIDYHIDRNTNFNSLALTLDGFITMWKYENEVWEYESRARIENFDYSVGQATFTLIVEGEITTVLLNGEQVLSYYAPNPLAGELYFSSASDVDNGARTKCTFSNNSIWEWNAVPDQTEIVSALAEDFKTEVNNLYNDGYLSSDQGEIVTRTEIVIQRALLNWSGLYITEENLDNFVVITDIHWETASETSDWWNTGCGFSFREEVFNSDYYEMYLNLEGKVEIWRRVNDRPVKLTINYYGKLDIPAGNAKLTLIVDGDKITVFINDTFVASVHDTKFSEGSLYFAVSSGTNKDFGTRCEFDNVFIWEIR